MPSIDTDLIMHHLYIAPGVNPIKNKLRIMNLHIALLVKHKLENILSEKIIRPIDYA